LLDPQRFPAHELAKVYLRRWRLEMCLRGSQDHAGPGSPALPQPAMARKEMLAFLIAHNLTRCVMAEAASLTTPIWSALVQGHSGCTPPNTPPPSRRRGTRKCASNSGKDLLRNLVRDQVPLRPERSEPRAVKRRPKPYPLLNQPRRQFKEIPHRTRYWKNNPRKILTLILAPFGTGPLLAI